MFNLSEDTVLMKNVINLFELHNIELLEDFQRIVTSILLGLGETHSSERA